MNKRINRKIHKFWLEMEIIDLSQISYWRKKLFEAEYEEVFCINKYCTEGLSPKLIKEIKRYNLRYLVSKVSADEADSWLSDCGYIIFKFWAEKHPSVKKYSGNNPEII